MQIYGIKIKKLFGLFDHNISFKIRDRITIIHGPNGVGKTTVLKLLAALFRQQLDTLQQTPYRQMEVTFSGKRQLIIEKGSAGKAREIARGLRFTFVSGKRREEYVWKGHSTESTESRSFPLRMIEDFVPHLSRIGPDEWIDHRTNEVLSLGEILPRCEPYLPFVERKSSFPSWLKELLGSISIYFIQTQRLLARSLSFNPLDFSGPVL